MKLKFPHLPVLAAPYLIFGLGVLLNVLAITANHGYMPVAASAIIVNQFGVTTHGQILDEVHRCMTQSDHLKILCDWIQIPRESVCSPGDLCLWAGEWLMGPSFVAWLTMLWRDANPEKADPQGIVWTSRT